MTIKRHSLFFAVALFSLPLSFFCSAQESAPAQALVKSDTIEQQIQEMKNPETPFTITIKQTDIPLLKIIDKVPVEVTITNNLGSNFTLSKPYFANVTFWNEDLKKQKLNAIIASEVRLIVGIGILIGGAALFLPNGPFESLVKSVSEKYHPGLTVTFDDDDTGKKVFAFVLKLGAIIGLVAQPGIFIDVKYAYLLQPHETITIKGCISSADMKKIQDGQLTPSIVMNTTALEVC